MLNFTVMDSVFHCTVSFLVSVRLPVQFQSVCFLCETMGGGQETPGSQETLTHTEFVCDL